MTIELPRPSAKELLVTITSAQWRAARALLNLSQADISSHLEISTLCIMRLESGNGSVPEDVRQIVRKALEAAGVIFVEENGDGPGVRLRKIGK